MKTFSKWDSLNHIKLISNIENKYKIKMTNKEISQATTFEKIYKVLNKRIKRSQGKMVKIKLINKIVNLNDWVKWLNDKEVTKYSEQRLKRHTHASQKKFLNNKIKAKDSKIFQIFFNSNFVGIVELGNIDKFHNTCEVMYFIGNKKYWGKGVAASAISLALKYAFKKLKVYKVFAGTYKKNVASQKVLTKNKFKLVGKMKNHLRVLKSSKKIRDDKLIYEKLK